MGGFRFLRLIVYTPRAVIDAVANSIVAGSGTTMSVVPLYWLCWFKGPS